MTGSGRPRRSGDPLPRGIQDRPRLALPGNLAVSLRHLEDDQLDALLRAANAEAERRGWKVPRADPRGPRRDAAGAAPRASARQPTKSRPLTPGQEKIVRAALAAGVGPAAIARQFGIPRTQVLRIAAAAKRGE
ncbi:MAG: hypothetical protein OXC28_20705 [Defluviicoccus sp.]|nr:hypothetical protein [Defluviicoccus sp.]